MAVRVVREILKFQAWTTTMYQFSEYMRILEMVVVEIAGAYWCNFISKNFTSKAVAMTISYPCKNRSCISSWVPLHDTEAANFKSFKISHPSTTCVSQARKKTIHALLAPL